MCHIDFFQFVLFVLLLKRLVLCCLFPAAKARASNQSEIMENLPIFATCTAPINMAVIKYWGKVNETLIIPANSSISATLSQDSMRSTTTAMASKTFTEDRLWLDGKEEPITDRMRRCFAKLREFAEDVDRDGVKIAKEELATWKLHICSVNNFPTAAGLASSASGFACLGKRLPRMDGRSVDSVLQ
jgi:diphosphomevalonate decarboxylase